MPIEQTSSRCRPSMGEARVVIVGGGPAGLTAAYELAKAGVRSLVLEADPHYVGGLARTVAYDGYHFDIGGHRFFSKSREVEDLWTELLPDDMLVRPRRSQIYYDRRFLAYPLRPLDVLRRLGPVETARCMASYAQARLKPAKEPESLAQWITGQFGSRLYQIFFADYTEKVWGLTGDQISAGWAAQRIQGLSLKTAVLNALKQAKGQHKGDTIKTLIEQFRYPRRGPGMVWNSCAARVRELGGQVLMGRQCSKLRKTGEGWLVHHVADGDPHDERVERADHVINSAPLRATIRLLEPAPPAEVQRAAQALRYRDFLTVALIMRDHGQLDANWIYVQDRAMKVARIQNYKAWSPEMVPDSTTTCFGMEYFCNVGDELWAAPDGALIELAQRELETLNLGDPRDILDACVVRQPKAYPVYDKGWQGRVDLIRRDLTASYAGLHQVGRGGMHRYNNQDHSMMTAMIVAQNILAGRELRDPWLVNQDAEYVEGGTAGEQRTFDAAADD